MTEHEAFGLVERICEERERDGQAPPVLLIDTYDDVPASDADKIPRVWLLDPATGELVPIVSMSHYEGMRARRAVAR